MPTFEFLARDIRAQIELAEKILSHAKRTDDRELAELAGVLAWLAAQTATSLSSAVRQLEAAEWR